METQTQSPESETKEAGIKSSPISVVESPGADAECLIGEIIYVDLDETTPHPRNAEICGNPGQDEDLIQNIRANGVLAPLFVTWEGVFRSGGRRLHRVSLICMQEFPDVAPDSPEEIEKLKLLLNRNAVLARDIAVRMEIKLNKATKRKALRSGKSAKPQPNGQ